MNLSQIIFLFILVIPFVLVFRFRLRIDLAALSIAALLGLGQYMGLGLFGPMNSPQDAVKAVSGLGQPVIMILISLFIITTSLEKSGVNNWITKRVLGLGGSSERKLVLLLSSVTAILSLFLKPVAAGVLMVPTAMEAAKKTGIKPSKLLIPVSYGSLLGGMASYFTTANIIASEMLEIASPPQAPLDLLSFIPTGGLIAVVGIGFLTVSSRKQLPEREPISSRSAFQLSGDEMQDTYQIEDRTWEVKVPADSTLVGQSLMEVGFGGRFGLSVAAIIRENRSLLSPLSTHIIQKNDVLILIGKEERVAQLAERNVIVQRNHTNHHLTIRGVRVAELLISPHSGVIGKSLIELGFRRRYKLTAVALHRGGTNFRTDIGSMKLNAGDALLITGADEQIEELRENPNFILIQSGLGDKPLHKSKAFITIGILLASIAASLMGMPVYLAMLLGTILLLLTGTLTMQEAYKSVVWEAIFLVSGMHAVSVAMIQSGMADLIGNLFVQTVTPFGPLGLAGAAFLLSTALSQLIGGQVTTMISGPITISAAIQMGIDAQAIAVATAIGCSACFITPFSHAVNTLIVTPGNYSFKDFLRIGWKLTLLCFVTLLLGMVLFWKLY